VFISKEIIITMINIILGNTTEGRAYIAHWTFFGYDELYVRADVENRIIGLLENIEFNNEVGNDRSYEECYQKLEKVIKDLLAEGANYTTQSA
jgi:hypothetical protein